MTPEEVNNIYKAMSLAGEVHHGQVDKTGEPYILHPIRVMLQGKTPEEMIVGLLHDVLEDGGGKVSRVQLLALFGHAIADAVHAITRAPDEKYPDYILRCKQNALARTVKRMDLEDNLALWRMNRLEDKTRERLHKKYAKAIYLLSI